MMVDPKAFWTLLGQRPIGATLVTVAGLQGPAGFLGLSATHVCAAPPTMLVSIDKRTTALAEVLAQRHFALNFLPSSAAALVEVFGGKAGKSGSDRFSEGQWKTGVTGSPVYRDALGVIECELEETLERHGVVLAFGSVVAGSIGDGEPLVLFKGKPFGLPSSSLA